MKKIENRGETMKESMSKKQSHILEGCPGAEDIMRPKPTYQTCPNCGEEVEIWADEVKAACENCGETVFGDTIPDRIEWCEHAEECVGTEKYKKFMENKGKGK